MHMTSGNPKLKPQLCWCFLSGSVNLWFSAGADLSVQSIQALCLGYFRMMWLRPYFKQLLLRKELFTDHETAPKIIHTQLPQDSRRGNEWNIGHYVLGCDLQGWSSQNIQLFTGIFALVSELEM